MTGRGGIPLHSLNDKNLWNPEVRGPINTRRRDRVSPIPHKTTKKENLFFYLDKSPLYVVF